jgi:hypothetical protein
MKTHRNTRLHCESIQIYEVEGIAKCHQPRARRFLSLAFHHERWADDDKSNKPTIKYDTRLHFEIPHEHHLMVRRYDQEGLKRRLHYRIRMR